MRSPVSAGRVNNLPARDTAEEGEEGVDLDHVVGLGKRKIISWGSWTHDPPTHLHPFTPQIG